MKITAKDRVAGAALLKMDEQYLYQWLTKRRAADPLRCPDVERVFEGRITCEDLREDLTWVRIADPAWPWHPHGRPAVDVGRQALDAVRRKQVRSESKPAANDSESAHAA